jgi:hypothetical protein
MLPLNAMSFMKKRFMEILDFWFIGAHYEEARFTLDWQPWRGKNDRPDEDS